MQAVVTVVYILPPARMLYFGATGLSIQGSDTSAIASELRADITCEGTEAAQHSYRILQFQEGLQPQTTESDVRMILDVGMIWGVSIVV